MRFVPIVPCCPGRCNFSVNVKCVYAATVPHHSACTRWQPAGNPRVGPLPPAPSLTGPHLGCLGPSLPSLPIPAERGKDGPGPEPKPDQSAISLCVPSSHLCNCNSLFSVSSPSQHDSQTFLFLPTTSPALLIFFNSFLARPFFIVTPSRPVFSIPATAL